MRSVSARQLRQSFRKRQFTRTHQQLHEASDWLRHDIDVEASGFARIWIGVGIRIAAELLEELAAEMLVDDIVSGEDK